MGGEIMYSTGYNKLFEGMLFITFNFNIGPINILPDFVGYMIIYSGLTVLQPQSEMYEKAKVSAIALIMITLKDIISLNGINFWQNLNSFTYIIIILDFIGGILNLYLIYIICKGIISLAEERGLIDLSESAKIRFKVYFVVTVIAIVYSPFSLVISLNISKYMLFVYIVGIIAALFIIELFNKCKIELKD